MINVFTIINGAIHHVSIMVQLPSQQPLDYRHAHNGGGFRGRSVRRRGAGRTSHNHTNTGDQSDKFGLDTVGICAGAKGRVICGCGEADACKEAVVGEDGEGVCEEAEDVDEIA